MPVWVQRVGKVRVASSSFSLLAIVLWYGLRWCWCSYCPTVGVVLYALQRYRWSMSWWSLLMD